MGVATAPFRKNKMSLTVTNCYWTTQSQLKINSGDDITSELQAWLALRASDSYSHILQLPSGTFTISGEISVPSNIKILGAGIDRTILEYDASFIAIGQTKACFFLNAASNVEIEDLSIIQVGLPPRTYSSHTITGHGTSIAIYGVGVSNALLRNVAVSAGGDIATFTSVGAPDMNVGNQGPSHGCQFVLSDNFIIEHCSFNYSSGTGSATVGSYGLGIDGCTNYSVLDTVCRENWWDGIKLLDSYANYTVFPPTGNRTKGGVIHGCKFIDNGQVVPTNVRNTSAVDGSAYDLTTGATHAGLGITGNGNGIDIAASFVTVSDCYARGNYGAQMQSKVQSTNVVFLNCIAEDAPVFPSPSTAAADGFASAYDGTAPRFGVSDNGSTQQQSAYTHFENCVAKNCHVGIQLDNPFTRVHNCSFRQNRAQGVYINDSAFCSSVTGCTVTGNNVADLYDSTTGTLIPATDRSEIQNNGTSVRISGNVILGIDFTRFGNYSDVYTSGNATSARGINGISGRFSIYFENIIDFTKNSYTSGGANGYITNVSSPAVMLNNYNTAGTAKSA